MGFSTGLALPLFLFVASITCDVSLGQSGTWNIPQAYAGNSASSFNNGMMYNGGDRSMGYGGSSAGAGAYGGGSNGGMAFGSSSAGAASYGAGNGDMTFSGSSASAGGGGYDGRAADAGANSGFGGFSAATAGSGGRGFYRGANGNGFGGFTSGSSGFTGGAPNNGGSVFAGGAPNNGGSVFAGGAPNNRGSGFGVATAGSEIQGLDVGNLAPVGNFTPGSGGVPLDNALGGFVAGQGNAPPAAAAIARVPGDYDGGSRVVLPTGAVRNGAFKPGRGRPRKFKPILFSGGFSLKNSLGYVKNAIKSSYFKLSLPDSLKRVAKCSGLFQSTGFSLDSMYQAYFSLYNDISASHGEMSFLEIGSLVFMEMALGFVKFLQSTPFACLMNIAGSFDYISLIYSLLGLMGCDSLCVAKGTTYVYSMLA